jgi:septum formation protein
MTGVAVSDTTTCRSADGVEITGVTFRSLSDDDIDRFVEAVRPLDRAGAYTVDGPGSLLVERYDGCYTNVLGLPLVRLDNLLRELGERLFTRIHSERARFL